jgi:hypothetical protein
LFHPHQQPFFFGGFLLPKQLLRRWLHRLRAAGIVAGVIPLDILKKLMEILKEYIINIFNLVVRKDDD